MKITTKLFNFRLVVITTLFFMFVLSINFVHAQETYPPLPESLTEGFENGDAGKISAFFRETLSVELMNHSGVFSKPQAEKLFQDFFLKNKVDSFKVLRTGNTGSAENVFTIVDMISCLIHFRVYLVRSNENGKYLIHLLSITKI